MPCGSGRYSGIKLKDGITDTASPLITRFFNIALYMVDQFNSVIIASRNTTVTVPGVVAHNKTSSPPLHSFQPTSY